MRTLHWSFIPQKALAVFLLGVNWYNSAKVTENLSFSVPAKDKHQFAKHRQALIKIKIIVFSSNWIFLHICHMYDCVIMEMSCNIKMLCQRGSDLIHEKLLYALMCCMFCKMQNIQVFQMKLFLTMDMTLETTFKTTGHF